jgi:tetratricopeptide (TPR) repeat protein
MRLRALPYFYERIGYIVKDTEKSILLYKKAADLYIQQGDKNRGGTLYEDLAFTFWSLGENEKTLLYLDKAIALEYRDHGYHTKTMFLMKQERWEEANKHLDKWLKIAPKYGSGVLPNRYKAEVLMKLGRNEEAIPYAIKYREAVG